MKIEIKNYKRDSVMSEETECFSATIYVDGVKAGTVSNRGHGGCNDYYWSNPVLGKQLEEYAQAQTTQYEFEKLDQLIDDIVAQVATEKQMKGWMKKHTCFRLKGDDRGTWRRLSGGPVDQAATELLTKKYGDQLEIILTDSNITEAAKL